MNLNMSKIPTLAICSPSFSANPILVQEVLAICPDAKINYAGMRFAGDELVKFIQGFEAALVGTEKITADIFKRCPDLEFIGRYGVGCDNIDQVAMQAAGVSMGWQGGVNRRSVAEMALVFLNGLARNMFFSGYALKQGRWEKHGGQQLSGKTVGIIGCGFTGSELIKMLEPFKCQLLICDILEKSEFINERLTRGDKIEQVDQERIFKEADFISLHVPLTDLTRYLISKENLSKMKKGAFLVNTSRGGVVNQDALAQALKNGSLAGAALDVFEEEPPTDLDFLALPNLMVTPHIGGNAYEAVLNMGRSAIEGVRDYFNIQSG